MRFLCLSRHSRDLLLGGAPKGTLDHRIWEAEPPRRIVTAPRSARSECLPHGRRGGLGDKPGRQEPLLSVTFSLMFHWPQRKRQVPKVLADHGHSARGRVSTGAPRSPGGRRCPCDAGPCRRRLRTTRPHGRRGRAALARSPWASPGPAPVPTAKAAAHSSTQLSGQR